MIIGKLKKIGIFIAVLMLITTFVLVLILASKSKIIPPIEVLTFRDCEPYFSEDAMSVEEKDGTYISPKQLGFMSKDKEYGAILHVAYTEGEVYILSSVTSNPPVCIKKNAVMGLKFENDEKMYAERSVDDGECIPGRHIDKELKATVVHKIPINSLMFKKLMTENLEAVGLDTNDVPLVLLPFNDESKGFVKNVFECVYVAVGKNIDLSSDNLLINNGFLPNK